MYVLCIFIITTFVATRVICTGSEWVVCPLLQKGGALMDLDTHTMGWIIFIIIIIFVITIIIIMMCECVKTSFFLI